MSEPPHGADPLKEMGSDFADAEREVQWKDSFNIAVPDALSSPAEQAAFAKWQDQREQVDDATARDHAIVNGLILSLNARGAPSSAKMTDTQLMGPTAAPPFRLLQSLCSRNDPLHRQGFDQGLVPEVGLATRREAHRLQTVMWAAYVAANATLPEGTADWNLAQLPSFTQGAMDALKRWNDLLAGTAQPSDADLLNFSKSVIDELNKTAEMANMTAASIDKTRAAKSLPPCAAALRDQFLIAVGALGDEVARQWEARRGAPTFDLLYIRITEVPLTFVGTTAGRNSAHQDRVQLVSSLDQLLRRITNMKSMSAYSQALDEARQRGTFTDLKSAWGTWLNGVTTLSDDLTGLQSATCTMCLGLERLRDDIHAAIPAKTDPAGNITNADDLGVRDSITGMIDRIIDYMTFRANNAAAAFTGSSSSSGSSSSGSSGKAGGGKT